MSDLPTVTEDERPWRGSYEWLSRRLEQALADKARETARANELAARVRYLELLTGLAVLQLAGAEL